MPEDHAENFNKIKTKMLHEVKQKKSARYERHSLSQMKQNKTETTDEFCRRIIKRIEACKIPE